MQASRLGLILSAAVLGSVALAGTAPPRQQGQNPQETAPIRVQVNVVNLFVTARDKKTKQIISTLEQSDFKVSEDNQEQKIAFFSKESTLPISQISIELYKPVTGGIFLGSRFAPESLKVPNMIDASKAYGKQKVEGGKK